MVLWGPKKKSKTSCFSKPHSNLIFFSLGNFMNVCMHTQSLNHVWLFVTLWTVAHQAPLSTGILQARILEWVAIPFSRGSSQPRDRTRVSWISCLADGFFITDPPGMLCPGYYECCAVFSCSILSDSLQPHGLQPARLLCSLDSPGKNNGASCHALLQGIFLTQELNPGLLHCSQILYQLNS